MNTEDLHAWITQEGLDDQWWVSQDDQMLEQPMTLAEVEMAAAAAPDSTFSLLPTAHAEDDPAPWTAYEPEGAASAEEPVEQEDTPFKVSSNQPAFLQKKQAAKKTSKAAGAVKQEQAKLGVTDEQRSYLVRYRILTPTGINNINREIAEKIIKRHTIKQRIFKTISVLFTLVAFAGLCWGTWLTYAYLKQNPVILVSMPEAILAENIAPKGQKVTVAGTITGEATELGETIQIGQISSGLTDINDTIKEQNKAIDTSMGGDAEARRKFRNFVSQNSNLITEVKRRAKGFQEVKQGEEFTLELKAHSTLLVMGSWNNSQIAVTRELPGPLSFDLEYTMSKEEQESVYEAGLDFRFVKIYEEPIPLSRTYQFERFEKAIMKNSDAEPLFFDIKHNKTGKVFHVVSSMLDITQLEAYAEIPIPPSSLQEIFVIQNFDELNFKEPEETSTAQE